MVIKTEVEERPAKPQVELRQKIDCLVDYLSDDEETLAGEEEEEEGEKKEEEEDESEKKEEAEDEKKVREKVEKMEAEVDVATKQDPLDLARGVCSPNEEEAMATAETHEPAVERQAVEKKEVCSKSEVLPQVSSPPRNVRRAPEPYCARRWVMPPPPPPSLTFFPPLGRGLAADLKVSLPKACRGSAGEDARGSEGREEL